MTHPSGPYPPEGYGPPPLGPQHPMGGPGHRFPPTVQQPTRDAPPQQPHVPGPRPEPDFSPPARKGFLGALLDMKFDYMVTPTVVKAFSVISIMLISFQCLVFLGIGLWIGSQDNWYAWGWMMVVASPLVWLFETLLLRICMESVIVRFKTAEYLRIIKDKL